MTSPNDMFATGGGGGKFPRLEELEGKLVMIRPIEIEAVLKPAQFGGKPGETQDRLTADVVIFGENGEVEDEFDEMYLSQVGIVNPARKLLRKNDGRPLLGRPGKVPSKIGKDQGFDTPEKIEEGLKKHFKSAGKEPKPNFAWGLNDPSDADKLVAMRYLTANSPLATASGE